VLIVSPAISTDRSVDVYNEASSCRHTLPRAVTVSWRRDRSEQEARAGVNTPGDGTRSTATLAGQQMVEV
jgi:hypothetical protein